MRESSVFLVGLISLPVFLLRLGLCDLRGGTDSAVWMGCLVVAGISIGFFLLARAAFYRGIRKYESVGCRKTFQKLMRRG